MIGLTVLAVIAIYIGVFAYIVVHARNRAEKIAAIAVALAVPFWDLPIGYLNFYRHCSQEGGIYVSNEVPASDAILIDSSAGYTPEEITRFGFKIVEYVSRDETIRYTAERNGLNKSIHTTPVSKIKIQFSGHQTLPWNLVRTEYIVSRLDNGKVVAKQTDFYWRGMWWQVAAAPLLGDGSNCLREAERPMLAVIGRAS